MSLNQENDDEFGPIADEPKTIIASNTAEDNSKVPDSDIFSSVAIKGELPKFDAVFELQGIKTDNLRDLVEVHDTLKANGAVSVEDINTIEALSPGFVNEDNPLGFYSQEPTQTRYKETMLSVAGTLDRQYSELRGLIVDNATNFWKAASENRERVLPQFVEGLICINKAIAKALLSHDRDQPEQIPYIFNNRKRFSDFLRAPCDRIFGDCVVAPGDNNQTGFEGTLVETFIAKYCDAIRGRQDLIATLQAVLSMYDSTWIKLHGQFYTFEGNVLLKQFNVEINYDSFTIGNLVGAIGSDRMRDYLKQLDEIYMYLQNQFQAIPEQVEGIEKNEQLTIAQKLDAIAKLSSQMHENQMLICAMLDLQGGICSLLCITAELFEAIA